MGLSIHSTTLMGFRTHRTHTYGAQQPQDPHLWGSAPPAPWGGHHPIGRLAALPHRGSLPHGGDGGLHPTPPLPAPQRPPPHGPPPSPPHRLRPQRTPNRPTECDPKGPPTAPPTPQNATPKDPHIGGGRGLNVWAWPLVLWAGPQPRRGFPNGRGIARWAWPPGMGVASTAARLQRGRGLNRAAVLPTWGSAP